MHMIDGHSDTLMQNAAEFEGIDPSFSDVAYHITTDTALGPVQEKGLNPSTLMLDEDAWARTLQALEAARPADIPVSLYSCVYGQLTNDRVGEDSYSLRNDIPKGEVLKIAVNPETTYVAPVDWVEVAHVALTNETGTAGVWDNSVGALRQVTFGEAANNYWRNAMPLAVFRELYEPLSSLSGPRRSQGAYKLKEGNNAFLNHTLPETMKNLEVIIPVDNGAIPPDRLQHDSSSLIGRIYGAGGEG